MWNRLSIGYKIPAAILGFALIVGVGVGASSYMSAARELNHQAEERLQTIAESRVTELNDYLESIRKDLQLVSTLPLTAEAIESFSKAWEELDGDKTGILKKAYIQDNPNPLGEKHLLNSADTGTVYDLNHEDYHPWFRELLTENGYYDIFLFDKAGNLIYSVFKEEDFATNFLRGGQWAQTDLGQAFRAAIESGPDTAPFF
ncbi:diguanylate cyclase [Roseibium sp. TrichSKD4]|uniref:cache domain-containing protein n=1 Tax=Roseibium sp. TrichSKD4 TaxID=744980 RepID=UPI0001E5650F|nr:cache domain-containing protein [Roseibium sp. TrichSKD4]EFO33441.1 diguanylate cyclase [Roseibium sp. TrichSKD4]